MDPLEMEYDLNMNMIYGPQNMKKVIVWNNEPVALVSSIVSG